MIFTAHFMENYSIYKKRIELVKNSSFTFRIPILINALDTELIVETNNVNFEKEIVIEFTFKKTTETTQENNVKVPVVLGSETTQILLKKTGLFENGNYLVFACIANANLNAELSIKNT